MPRFMPASTSRRRKFKDVGGWDIESETTPFFEWLRPAMTRIGTQRNASPPQPDRNLAIDQSDRTSSKNARSLLPERAA
jgi:hypothetical protein